MKLVTDRPVVRRPPHPSENEYEAQRVLAPVEVFDLPRQETFPRSDSSCWREQHQDGDRTIPILIAYGQIPKISSGET